MPQSNASHFEPHPSTREPSRAGSSGAQDTASSQEKAPSSRKSNRGFASMDAEKQREIASKGGRAAHQKGTAHQFTPDEAREAGRKGGGTVSKDRAHMAEIGRIGGQSRGANRAKRAQDSDAPPASSASPDTSVENEGEAAPLSTSAPTDGEYRH